MDGLGKDGSRSLGLFWKEKLHLLNEEIQCLILALVWGSHFKVLIMSKFFNVMGNTLSGELFYLLTGLVESFPKNPKNLDPS